MAKCNVLTRKVRTRLVYSKGRVMPSVIGLTYGMEKCSKVRLVASSVHTGKVPRKGDRLNKRIMVMGSNVTGLRSKAVTKDVLACVRTFGGIVRFAKTAIRRTIGVASKGRTGRFKLRAGNTVTIKGSTSVIMLGSTFSLMRAVDCNGLTWKVEDCGVCLLGRRTGEFSL